MKHTKILNFCSCTCSRGIQADSNLAKDLETWQRSYYQGTKPAPLLGEFSCVVIAFEICRLFWSLHLQAQVLVGRDGRLYASGAAELIRQNRE
jgi:hypothetical protein